jgi:hypothetical protein
MLCPYRWLLSKEGKEGDGRESSSCSMGHQEGKLSRMKFNKRK